MLIKHVEQHYKQVFEVTKEVLKKDANQKINKFLFF